MDFVCAVHTILIWINSTIFVCAVQLLLSYLLLTAYDASKPYRLFINALWWWRVIAICSLPRSVYTHVTLSLAVALFHSFSFHLNSNGVCLASRLDLTYVKIVLLPLEVSAFDLSILYGKYIYYIVCREHLCIYEIDRRFDCWPFC